MTRDYLSLITLHFLFYCFISYAIEEGPRPTYYQILTRPASASEFTAVLNRDFSYHTWHIAFCHCVAACSATSSTYIQHLSTSSHTPSNFIPRLQSRMSSDNVTLASNVLGTIGTVLWCIQLIPQIWHNWRRKQTDGLPATMMFLWASCSVPMGAYLILQQVNIPLQIQPQIFGFFSLVSWGQVLYYNHDFSRTKTIIWCSGMVVLFGGLEALLILTLRIPYNNGVTWPDIVVGVVAAILLSAGLIPPYFELWKRDGRVIGFNWVFLSIDTLGGLFSLFALAAQGSFDILGGIMYILVIILEAGIYISHIVWRIRYRKLRKEAKASGKSIDDLLVVKKHDTQEAQDIEKGIMSDIPGGAENHVRMEQTSIENC